MLQLFNDDVGNDVAELTEALRRTKHACLIYDSKEEQQSVSAPFLRCGLRNGEKCFYVRAHSSDREVLDSVGKDDFGIEKFVEAGSFCLLSREETYLRLGRFDPDDMLSLIGDRIKESKEQGYPAARATAEGSKPRELKLLTEYESRLNIFLPDHNMLVLCQYSRKDMPASVIKQVLYTHPLVWYRGRLMINPYYIPPGQFLSDDFEHVEVQSLLDNIAVGHELLRMNRDLARSEHLLATANKELEAANTELAKARDQALLASNLKSAFVANLSHEVRTPLAGIIGMNGLLQSSELTSEQRENANSIDQCARNLLAIMNDLLDLSKIEAGKVTLENVNFNAGQLVTDCVKLLESSAASKGIKLGVTIDRSLPAVLVGDPVRLRQVLTNLISNSVKFTERGEVSIRVDVQSQNDEVTVLKFLVRDTGIGISKENQQRLFEPFMRLDHRYDGTGLGLCICKRLVDLMDGDINVDSTTEEGSTFQFQVPLRAAQASLPEAQGAPLASEPIPKGKLVLIAEDNAVLRRLAIMQLSRMGLVVHAVENGREAIEACKQKQFDLILMDCQMPDIDGFAASRLIREMETDGRRTPIVAITASAMKEDQVRCLEAGMDACLTKPVDAKQLFEQVQRAIAKSDQ